ncbi:MAG: DUF333 domain-containing protein [Nanoarchaeota archaeon]|nr:DUF333 domain-containing protein [Nanoarchaeota archaeon]
MKNKYIMPVMVILLFSFLIPAINALPNPSSAYCTEMEYSGRIAENEAGQYGLCIFPDGSECGEWDFYEGRCGQEWSYCAINGYGIREPDQSDGSFNGAVCINEQGEDVGKVAELMGLNSPSTDLASLIYIVTGLLLFAAVPISIAILIIVLIVITFLKKMKKH